MAYHIAGVTGGIIDLMDKKQKELQPWQTQTEGNINSQALLIQNLQPKYLIMQVNSTTVGNILWSIFPSSTTHELAAQFTYGQPVAGCFTKTDAGSAYYFFTMNIPMDATISNQLVTITVRHKPSGQAEYSYFVKAAHINLQAETIDFSFTLKLSQNDYFAIQTSHATVTSAAAGRGYCQITKLG